MASKNDQLNIGTSETQNLTETWLSTKEVTEYIETEVSFRVEEALKTQRLLQTGVLGFILLVACVGLALTLNAYTNIEDTKAKNDRISLVMAQVEAILKATGNIPKAPQ
jgi:hypothetical protein